MSTFPLSKGYSGAKGVMKRQMRNMFLEMSPEGPYPSIRRPRPGLILSQTTGNGPIRLSLLWQGNRIIVSDTDCFYNGTRIGLIPGSDLCRFATSEDEVVICANNTVFKITSIAVAQITDPDLFANVIDVLFLSGRFIYLDGSSSQFQWSAVGDCTTIDGLDFATADENSSHVLRAGFVVSDDIIFHTDQSSEWWAPVDDGDAPFQRSPGRKYTKGIAARNTTALLDNTEFFLGSDKMIYRASAVPTRVSNFDIEAIIAELTDAQLSECSAFSYTIGGHALYIINLPGHGTWALDVATSEFHEWHTWNQDRFRGSVFDGELVGDIYSGKMYRFDLNTHIDDVDPLERVVSAYIPLSSNSYRNFNATLRTVRGVGNITSPGANPVVEMRYSDNDGANFTPWGEAPLGAIGVKDDRAKAMWLFLGSIIAPGRLFEFRCTRPVYFCAAQLIINEKSP